LLSLQPSGLAWRFGLRSPLGFFAPLQIEAFNRLTLRKAHLCVRPDLPSLPAAVLFYKFNSGSTFQARYRSPGFLFLEPLGTFYIMQRARNFVK